MFRTTNIDSLASCASIQQDGTAAVFDTSYVINFNQASSVDSDFYRNSVDLLNNKGVIGYLDEGVLHELNPGQQSLFRPTSNSLDLLLDNQDSVPNGSWNFGAGVIERSDSSVKGADFFPVTIVSSSDLGSYPSQTAALLVNQEFQTFSQNNTQDASSIVLASSLLSLYERVFVFADDIRHIKQRIDKIDHLNYVPMISWINELVAHTSYTCAQANGLVSKCRKKYSYPKGSIGKKDVWWWKSRLTRYPWNAGEHICKLDLC